jgi:hypothetical protein
MAMSLVRQYSCRVLEVDDEVTRHAKSCGKLRLLDRLILSLDHDQVRDEAWAALATERAAGLGSGQVVALDGPETVVRLRAIFA